MTVRLVTFQSNSHAAAVNDFEGGYDFFFLFFCYFKLFSMKGKKRLFVCLFNKQRLAVVAVP